MSYLMEDYLNVVTPHLSADLVSPIALSQLHELAKILPPFSHAGFECRLGANQPRVDLQLNLSSFALNLPENFVTHPVWQFFQNFCQEWAEPTSSLHQGVRNIWLEFDVDGQPSQIPIPCLFLTLNQEAASEAQELIAMALRLFNHPVPSQLESNLQRCINFLPESSGITHLGAMLSRSAQAVRINVAGINPEELLDYLIQIGWTDLTNTFSTLVSSLSDFVDDIVLSIDVSDTVLPRIGLECFLAKQPKHEPRWRLFLDYLVERKLCTPAKKNALLAWYGFSQKASAPDLWPSNLIWGDLFLSFSTFSIFYRRLNHIKIVYQPGTILEAKGYLAFGHRWFDRNSLIRGKLQKTED